MGELTSLPNIGKKLEEQLIHAGIDTVEKLRETGAKTAWLRIKEFDESACFLRLSALEGAVEGINKSMLSDEVKADLKEFYHSSKKK